MGTHQGGEGKKDKEYQTYQRCSFWQRGKDKKNPGNIRFQEMVQKMLPEYFLCSNDDAKTQITKTLVVGGDVDIVAGITKLGEQVVENTKLE